jgi:hypothetical protein
MLTNTGTRRVPGKIDEIALDLHKQTRFGQGLAVEALPEQMMPESLRFDGCEANPESLEGVRTKAPLLCTPRLDCRGKPGTIEIGGCKIYRLQRLFIVPEPLLSRPLLIRPFREGDMRALGKVPQRFRKSPLVEMHHPGKDITAFATVEAVIEPLLGIDMEASAAVAAMRLMCPYEPAPLPP